MSEQEALKQYITNLLVAEGHKPDCAKIQGFAQCECKRTRSYFDAHTKPMLPVLNSIGANGYVARLTRQMHVSGLIHSCLTCAHFEEGTETCNVVTPPLRPPARVIAYGCPSWMDPVPF